MVRLNVAGVEDKRASMRRAMPILPSNILECFPLRSFCGGNTTFIFLCHVTSKQPIESMRLHYTIAREALNVKGSLSGVDMRHGEGVVSYMGFIGMCRPLPPDRVWFFRATILREGIISPFVGIVVHNTISFYSPIFCFLYCRFQFNFFCSILQFFIFYFVVFNR